MMLFRSQAWSIAQRFRVWLLLLFVVLLAGGHLVFRDAPVLQTNLLSLLPQTERNPVAERALNTLAGFSENRVFFLVGAADAQVARQQAQQFAASLKQSEVFTHVTLDVSSRGFQGVQDWFTQYRFQWGFNAPMHGNADPHAWLLQTVQAKLFSPLLGGATVLPVAQDPFGFSQSWFDRLPTRAVKLLPQEGVLTTQGDGKTWVFLVAGVKGSIYDQALASPVVAAVRQAEQSLSAAQVLRAGAVFHAELARSKAQSDVDLIGLGSLIGILLMLYWVFRSPRPVVAAVVSVGFGVAWACVVCVGVSGHLHLITLVFGASLIGEAVDYSIQYFAAHLDAKDRWNALSYLKQMGPGLRVALGTSLLGYGALLFSPFVALSQIALFAMTGLFAAWLSVVLFLPWCLRKPVKPASAVQGVFAKRCLVWWTTQVSVRACVVGVCCLLGFSVLGMMRLEGQDDVRLLISPDARLAAQEAQFKSLAGVSNSSQFFLVEGQSIEEVLQREEALVAALHPLIESGQLNAYQAVSTFVPSHHAQTQHVSQWAQWVFEPQARLSDVFNQVGFQPELASSLRAEFDQRRAQIVDVDTWLSSALSVPWRHLWMGKTERGYASLVIPDGFTDGAMLQGQAQALQGVSWVDKPASVSHLFQDYRQYSVYWFFGALSVVLALLVYRYGWRAGCAVLLPTVLALSFALGMYGWLGYRITLFNMMALMLVLGVGVNYAVFLVEGGARSAIAFVGVQLSAATTLLSFGLLALSSMPVLAGFGLMLTLGIASAVVLSPLSLVLIKPSQGDA